MKHPLKAMACGAFGETFVDCGPSPALYVEWIAVSEDGQLEGLETCLKHGSIGLLSESSKRTKGYSSKYKARERPVRSGAP